MVDGCPYRKIMVATKLSTLNMVVTTLSQGCVIHLQPCKKIKMNTTMNTDA